MRKIIDKIVDLFRYGDQTNERKIELLMANLNLYGHKQGVLFVQEGINYGLLMKEIKKAKIRINGIIVCTNLADFDIKFQSFLTVDYVEGLNRN